MYARRKVWLRCSTDPSEQAQFSCLTVENTRWQRRRVWLQSFRLCMVNAIPLRWWVMDLIRICQAGVRITELSMLSQSLWLRSWLVVEITARSVLHSRNISAEWQRIRKDGVSHLQHCLVHIRHRLLTDFRQSEERTACPEHLNISMYRRHWYPLQLTLPKKEISLLRNWKKQVINLYGWRLKKMNMSFRYMNR